MGTPQPLVPLRWLTEAITERDRLEALNAELLEFIKEQLRNSKSETDHHGVTTFDEAEAEQLIARAEGRE